MIRIKFLNKKLIRKSNASLNTNNEQVKFEIKNTIPFILASKNENRSFTEWERILENYMPDK